jgi:RNA polymerase sigma-70 factor (ECF subfamily)
MKDFTQHSDEELLTRMRGGEEAAFVALYRRRQGNVYRFAWQMSGSPQTAEDVTQDVFLALISGDNGFDAAKGSLVNYLYGAARFQILRRWERERRRAPLGYDADDGESWETPDPDADLFAQVSRRETVERVREAVLTLPPHYREVVVLCDLHELDYAVAAQIMDCAIGTVRSRLHRARAILAGKLRAIAPETKESVAPPHAAEAWA